MMHLQAAKRKQKKQPKNKMLFLKIFDAGLLRPAFFLVKRDIAKRNIKGCGLKYATVCRTGKSGR